VDVRTHPTEARRRLGILIDIPFPYEEMSVHEYLTFFARLAGLPPAEVPARVHWAMAFLGQTQHALNRIGRLSMGERQRTELARVFLSPAQALFLDEPFSNVDVAMRLGLRRALRAWVSEGRGVLFTSHNLLESETIVDRFAFLNLGRIVAVGTAKELKEKLLAPAYLLEVSDVDRALGLLTGVPHQSLERAGEGLVRIGLLDRKDAGAVAKSLVDGGVDLLEMRSVGTMEDVYTRLAHGGTSVPTGGKP
jgi:ABC-type multidrug transport system ATPase subunit